MKHVLIRISAAFMVLCLCSSFIYGIFGKRCGIQGYVYEIKGNQMPSPDEKRAPPRGIKTTVLIYKLTSPSQVVPSDRPGFYKSVNSKLIRSVSTDENGFFKVNLQPGKYSLFTRAEGMYYANNFDQFNNIYPVEVQKKKMTDVVIKQDFNAAY
jgi:hypothetical protein